MAVSGEQAVLRQCGCADHTVQTHLTACSGRHPELRAGEGLAGQTVPFLDDKGATGLVLKPCIDEKDTAQKQKNKITYFMQKRNIEAGKKIKKLAFSKRSPVSKKLRTRDAKSTFPSVEKKDAGSKPLPDSAYRNEDGNILD